MGDRIAAAVGVDDAVDHDQPLAALENARLGDEIGGLAFDHRLPIFELTPKAITLEEAFFELTESSTEFRADPGTGTGTYERQMA